MLINVIFLPICMEDKSIFLDVFGDAPINRILDFLVIHEEFDYSMKDIAENAGVGYATLKLFWPKLEKSKIVVLTRTIGNAKLYKLNIKNKAAQRFKDFYWETARTQTEELLAKETARGRCWQSLHLKTI